MALRLPRSLGGANGGAARLEGYGPEAAKAATGMPMCNASCKRKKSVWEGWPD
jgi:hypothetical protein